MELCLFKYFAMRGLKKENKGEKMRKEEKGEKG